MIKIYTDLLHYDHDYRKDFFPLLKLILKPKLDAEGKVAFSHGGSNNYEMINEPENADVLIFPMSWNYYHKTKQLDKAVSFFNSVKETGKEVWIAMLDDFGLPQPELDNGLIFRASGYSSKLPANNVGLPIFISDPLKGFFNREDFIPRDYHAMPKVGFCGQASFDLFIGLKEVLRGVLRNVGYYLNQYPHTPEKIMSSSFLRGRILKKLQKSSLINSNFIIRKLYRAGAKNKEERHKTTLEFYNNIKDSDYILCVRGAGNFSVRLYETLAMGRIPVYINTESLLPLQDKIEWKKHMVWVEADEIHKIDDIINDFHQLLDAKSLNQLFDSNRELWKSKLCLETFFKTFYDEH